MGVTRTSRFHLGIPPPAGPKLFRISLNWYLVLARLNVSSSFVSSLLLTCLDMTCEGVVKVSVPPRAAEVIAAGVKTVAAARLGVGRAAATMEVKMVQETEVISVRRRWGNPEVTSAEVEMMEARAAVVVRVERATPGSRVAQGTRLAAAGNGAPRQWARRVPVTLC